MITIVEKFPARSFSLVESLLEKNDFYIGYKEISWDSIGYFTVYITTENHNLIKSLRNLRSY